MIIDGRKRTGVLAAVLVSGMCGPYGAMADAIVTLSGPTSNAGVIDLSTTPPRNMAGWSP